MPGIDMKIVMHDSDDAAHKASGVIDGVVADGWISRHGRFFCGADKKTNEHLARYDGCTHSVCECGRTKIKHYTRCAKCIDDRNQERYDKFVRQKWNQVDPVYSGVADRYFQDISEIIDYCDDNSMTFEDLRLQICKPVYAREIDPEEYYQDDLPEDCGDVPAKLQEIFDELNHKIRQSQIVLSWVPSKVAVDLEGVAKGSE